MKRASYREAIEVIAMNDEPESMDVDEMSGMASVMVVAAIFGKTQEQVATAVVLFREKVTK